jgi:hypothetical protein
MATNEIKTNTNLAVTASQQPVEEINVYLVDNTTFNTIKYIIVLICTMLLIWFFIRTNLEDNFDRQYHDVHAGRYHRLEGMSVAGDPDLGSSPHDDPLANQLTAEQTMNEDARLTNEEVPNVPYELTDKNYTGNIMHGVYGDVPVYIYDDVDDAHSSEWRTAYGGIHLRNSKTYWKEQIIDSSAIRY